MRFSDSSPTEALLFRTALQGESTIEPLWTSEELGEVLLHQLQVPLEEDLRGVEPSVPAVLRSRSLGSLPLVTFADLLRHPKPPQVLLEALKKFGKLHRSLSSPAIGPAIATLLYYAAVVLARVRLNERITAMNDAQIAEGVRWSLAQTWLDDETRSVLQSALDELLRTGG